MVVTAIALHGVNAALVGRSHTNGPGITTSSAMAQSPSIYLACFYLARASCFPPKLPAMSGGGASAGAA